MTRHIEWSDRAAEDFDNAIEYIALDSENASRLISKRILSTIDLLGEMPTGHQGRVKGTYEKLAQRTPYIIAYSMSDYLIYILRIVHASRDWPEDEWPAE